jgi:hypothetical protein
MRHANVRLTADIAGKAEQFSHAVGFDVEKEIDCLDKLKETIVWQELEKLAQNKLAMIGIAIWFSEPREKFLNEK